MGPSVYAVMIVWDNGSSEFVAQGTSTLPATFKVFQKAKELRDFIREGIGEDDGAQAICAVKVDPVDFMLQ